MLNSVFFLRKKAVVLVPFLIFLLSCTEHSILETEGMVEAEPIGYPDVDERLWPFFGRFEEEGKKRGISISLIAEGISGEISDIDKERVVGQCNFNRQNPNHVTIDLDFWRNADKDFREFVVFHELGHCHLFRAHRETQNTNGTCKSIMRSGNGDCFDNYNRFTRNLYLDELFDPQFAQDIFKVSH